MIKKKIHEEEEKEWKKAMEKKPKLRTYQTLKDKLVLEEYLKINTNAKGRQIATSIRTGSNNLRIETGRWTRPKEKIEDRLCMECMNGSIEDEKHFLIECEIYDDLREKMYRQIEIETNDIVKFDLLTNEEKWTTLIKGK